MSELPDTSYLSHFPTTSSLLYLLGQFASEWQEIGRLLNISEYKLAEIRRHITTSDNRMKEMFYCWLLRGEECDWFAIQRVLEATGKKDLAEKLPQYLLQQPKQLQYTNIYEDQTLNRLTRQFDPTLRDATQDIVSALKTQNIIWYQIGSALHVPKSELDKIDELADEEEKLSKLVNTWMELDEEYCWQKLINSLIEIDFDYTAKAVEKMAHEKIEACIKKERSDDPTMQQRFQQYRRRGDWSLMSENPEYQRLKKEIIGYFDFKSDITDIGMMDELKKYDIIEEYMISKLKILYYQPLKEIEDDKKRAEAVKATLTERRENFQADKEEKWSNLQKEFEQSDYRREIHFMAFESDMQEAQARLEKQIECAEINYRAICNDLNKLKEWKSRIDEVVSIASELLPIYATPPVSRLYYVLGELIADWRTLGQHFRVPEANLNQIAADNPNKSYRCLIEVLNYWVNSSEDCNWKTVEKVLKEMGERDLAETIQHYTRELTRIQHRRQNRSAQCKKFVPLKNQSGG